MSVRALIFKIATIKRARASDLQRNGIGGRLNPQASFYSESR